MNPPPNADGWKVLAGSVTGISHLRDGGPCQDYALVAPAGLPGPDTAYLLLACADGAGSAARADVAARLACREVVSAASAALADGLPAAAITPDTVAGWYGRARARLSLEACIAGLDLREFACTLLLAVVGDRDAAFAQLGDGAIVYRDGDGYGIAGWPQSGEYANTTHFLTAPDFPEHLTVRTLVPGPDEIALLTDGLQTLALHYATRRVHAPFFDPMFAALRREPDPDRLRLPLLRFLSSGPVTDRTDDDTTLVIATRRPANGND